MAAAVARKEAMRKPKFSLTDRDEALEALVAQTEHRTLAVWAKECAERVLPFVEAAFPEDARPRQALDTLQVWIDTGVFRMAVIRSASLGAHAAARAVGEDNPARSAARAAGQAVATAHVRTHAPGAAIYALQTIYRATGAEDVAAAMAAERAWQFTRLLQLTQGGSPGRAG
jgi:hypothetical protein